MRRTRTSVSLRERAEARTRSFAAWSLAHGVQRRGLLHAAKRGDLAAQYAIDPVIASNPFAHYERMRPLGPVIPGSVVLATVDHAAANQVLRGDDFGTGAGHAELPPLLRRAFSWAADPYALSPIDPP